MTFGHPSQLYWLLVLLPMAGAVIWFVLWKRRLHREVGDAELMERMTSNHSSTLRWVRIALFGLGAACLAVALAQPRWGRTTTTVERSGVDVVFALDLSKSMLARDVPPNRLEASTDEIKDTLTRLDGDRAGLVVFTAVSFVQSPLTTDYGALRFYLDKLDPQQMSVGGTAIGRAMRDATELLIGHPLDEEGDDTEMDRADTQLIVLITDGEDHKTDPVAAAKTAREHGIHVVSVGVGGEKGVRIPVMGDDGEVKGYKRDRQGNVVQTKLNADQLKKMAETTRGTYLEYEGRRSIADRLDRYIDRLQKTKFEDEMTQKYQDRFMYALIPGFLCLLFGILIGERRSGVLGWATERSDEEADGEGGSGWLGLLLVLACLPLSGCSDLFRSPHPDVERGNRLVDKKQYDQALKAYDRAEKTLAKSSSLLSYNRGLVHLGKDQHDEARRTFANALQADEPTRRFDAHYNLGVTFAKKEEWKEAAESFKAALRLAVQHPEAIETTWVERARHNLELAFRKLYPPCRQLEDQHEENDDASAATSLRAARKKAKKRQKRAGKGGSKAQPDAKKGDPTEDLTLCGLDDDWYAIKAIPGSTITVEATFRQLRDEPLPGHEFLPKAEQLEIALFGANGDSRLARDRTGPEPETNAPPGSELEPPVTRKIEEFEVGRDVPLGSNSTVKLRVSAVDQLEFEYDLDVNVQPPCRALQEKSEDNDTRERAKLLKESGRKKGQLCPGDADWYKVEAEMGDAVFVDLRPASRKKKGSGGAGGGSSKKAAPEDFQLEMIDADTGETVASTRREGPFLTTGLQNIEEDRTFYVRVTGSEQSRSSIESAYALDLYAYPPCIVGDDEYEENDELKAAAKLGGKKSKSRIHRYLRLCPDDPDYYTVRSAIPKQAKKRGAGGAGRRGGGSPMLPGGSGSGSQQQQGNKTPPKPRVGVGVSLVEASDGDEKSKASTDDGTSDDEADEGREMSLDLLKGDGSVLAEGRAPDAGRKQASAKAAERRPEGFEFHRVAHATLDAAGSKSKRGRSSAIGRRGGGGRRGRSKGPRVPVRVKGEPTFYHLVELTPRSGKKQKRKKKQQNKQQNKQNKRSKQQKQKKKRSADKEKSADQKKKAEKKKAKKKKADPKKTEQILKALENSDTNFQMKKALKNKGKRRIEKDW